MFHMHEPLAPALSPFGRGEGVIFVRFVCQNASCWFGFILSYSFFTTWLTCPENAELQVARNIFTLIA